MQTLTLTGVLASLYVGTLIMSNVQLPVVSAAALLRTGDDKVLLEGIVTSSEDSSIKTKLFVDQVQDFTNLANQSDNISSLKLERYRAQITESFVAAINSIEKGDGTGNREETTRSRIAMEKVIEQYMLSPNADVYTSIRDDLHTYSTFMTKIIIARAINQQ